MFNYHVNDLSRRWSVEIGFFATAAGQNAGRELGRWPGSGIAFERR